MKNKRLHTLMQEATAKKKLAEQVVKAQSESGGASTADLLAKRQNADSTALFEPSVDESNSSSSEVSENDMDSAPVQMPDQQQHTVISINLNVEPDRNATKVQLW